MEDPAFYRTTVRLQAQRDARPRGLVGRRAGRLERGVDGLHRPPCLEVLRQRGDASVGGVLGRGARRREGGHRRLSRGVRALDSALTAPCCRLFFGRSRWHLGSFCAALVARRYS